MRVIHIIAGLATGGAELMLKRLVESAPDNISSTVVVSLTNSGTIGESLRANGVKVHELGMSSIWDSPMTIYRLVRLIRKYHPEIVQTWMYHADLLGGIAARLAGSCKVVWGIRSTAIPQGPISFTYWLVRFGAILSYVIPHRIICCAKSAQLAHIKLGYAQKKMTVIPNGYDFSVFDQHLHARETARTQLGYRSNEVVIGVVGRYDPLKDFHNFVVTASKVSSKHENVKYLMVGRNNEWSNEELAGWIKDHGLVNNFQLVGEQGDVPYFLAAMDIFCLSSVNEGFPNVVVEAMAMELPCVVTRAGDAAEIVGNEMFVAPVKDSSELAAALLRICDMEPPARRKLGVIAAQKVRADYGIGRIRREYELVYANCTIK